MRERNTMESARKARCFLCEVEADTLILVPSIVSLETEDGEEIGYSYPVCKECYEKGELV